MRNRRNSSNKRYKSFKTETDQQRCARFIRAKEKEEQEVKENK